MKNRAIRTAAQLVTMKVGEMATSHTASSESQPTPSKSHNKPEGIKTAAAEPSNNCSASRNISTPSFRSAASLSSSLSAALQITPMERRDTVMTVLLNGTSLNHWAITINPTTRNAAAAHAIMWFASPSRRYFLLRC